MMVHTVMMSVGRRAGGYRRVCGGAGPVLRSIDALWSGVVA